MADLLTLTEGRPELELAPGEISVLVDAGHSTDVGIYPRPPNRCPLTGGTVGTPRGGLATDSSRGGAPGLPSADAWGQVVALPRFIDHQRKLVVWSRISVRCLT